MRKMNRKEFKEMLSQEAILYGCDNTRIRLKKWLIQDQDYLCFKYHKFLRKTEFYYNRGNKILYEYYQRKKNKLGASLGIIMWHNCADEGLHIWHYGTVMVNGHAVIGKNCQLHGQNCIGNKGDFDTRAPHIGDNVDIGIGARIIGNIYIADNVKIGANAVVNKSCYTEGAILVGVPARELKKDEKAN